MLRQERKTKNKIAGSCSLTALNSEDQCDPGNQIQSHNQCLTRLLTVDLLTSRSSLPCAYIQIVLRRRLGRGPSNKVITKHEHVHLRTKEAIERFLWPADDRLVLIERRIEYHGYTSDCAECLN